MENVTLRQTNDIVINFGQGRFALFISNVIKCQNLVHRHNNIAENVIFWNYITVGVVTAYNDKLMGVLIVPKNFVYSFIHEFNVVVSLSVRIKDVDLSILVLKNEFCGRLVYEHSENGVVRPVLHDDVLVLQMVEFQFWCIVKHN